MPKAAIYLVKMTKANRFAYKKFAFVDKGVERLYNCTIRAVFIYGKCKKCPKKIAKIK